ncbi:hypothetical protein BGZ91_006297 [Linnemannia elongata]|nr:hypothetical protein BGZ91_006297 [Linnemannia elongata]
MQFKTLAIAAVAFVAVANAQAFEQNACSACVTSSFSKDTSCSTLTPDQSAKLTAGFSSGNPDILKLSAAIVEATTKIKMLDTTLGCAAVPSGGNVTTPSTSTTGGAGGSPTATPKPAAAVQLNMPYVLSVAAIGLAALAGL